MVIIYNNGISVWITFLENVLNLLNTKSNLLLNSKVLRVEQHIPKKKKSSTNNDT